MQICSRSKKDHTLLLTKADGKQPFRIGCKCGLVLTGAHRYTLFKGVGFSVSGKTDPLVDTATNGCVGIRFCNHTFWRP
jgi:hypothetical protein